MSGMPTSGAVSLLHPNIWIARSVPTEGNIMIRAVHHVISSSRVMKLRYFFAFFVVKVKIAIARV